MPQPDDHDGSASWAMEMASLTKRGRIASRGDGCVLGIDLGSTWCKAAFVDRNGEILAQGRASTWGAPAFGFSAVELEDIWAAVRDAVSRASAQLRSARVVREPAAIALSSRHGSGLWLDAHDQAIELAPGFAPGVLDEAMDAVYTSGYWDAASLCTYAPVLASRTVYLQRQSRARWRRVRRAGALHDGLLLRLTGRWVTNPATGPGAAHWPRAIGRSCGLPMTAFPEILPFGSNVGPLTVAAAHDLGLPPAVPVAAGYHDGAAATVGAGVLAVGDGCITLGTSAALRVVTDRPVAGWFGYPLAQDRWAWMRGTSGALAEVDAVAAELDRTVRGLGEWRHESLTAAARLVPPGAYGLSLPIGALEQDLRPAVQAACAAGHAAGAIYRAALEGVAWRLHDLVTLADEAGIGPQRCVATGGAASNKLLLCIVSAILSRPLSCGDSEAGVRGAAVAAAVAAGWYPTVADAAGQMGGPQDVVAADPGERDAYGAIVAARGPRAAASRTQPFWRSLPT